MEWILEISQDYLVSKMILIEQPFYLASGKLSKRKKIPFMDVWKKYKDGLKQCGFGLYKSDIDPFTSETFLPTLPSSVSSSVSSSFSRSEKEKSEKEKSEKEKSNDKWILYFRTRKRINNDPSSLLHEVQKKEDEKEAHIMIRNKYYNYFCKN